MHSDLMGGRTVLVTGGAGNLGQAVTRAFLEAGARVAVPLYKMDRPESLDHLAQQFGPELYTFAIDLTTERGAAEAVNLTLDWSDRLDAVAHLVGGYAGGTLIADTPSAVWDRMIDLNLRSAWLVARSALPPMIAGGGGALVFVSARAARAGRRGHAAYAVAKAGVLTLAEAIAEEYASVGIRSLAVAPATLDTPANRSAMPNANHAAWVSVQQLAEQIVQHAAGAEPTPS